jgi:hypothetical protein
MMKRPAAIEYEAAQPWDRQPGEGGRAFAAFRIYRDLGPVDRSLALVAQATGKSLTWMKEWSRRNRWVGRAAAWDAENQRLSRAQHTKGLEEMARRQALIGQLAQQRAWQRLTAMTDEDVMAMSPSEAVRLIESGVRIERLSRGESNIAGRLPGVGPIQYAPAPRNPVVEFVRQHPDRVGPVLDAVRQLSAAMSEVDPTRVGEDGVREDQVDVADEEDEADDEGRIVPYWAEGSSDVASSSEQSESSRSASGPEVPEKNDIPRGMPGFVTRRDLSRA